MAEFDELRRREAEAARHRENRGRSAGVFQQFTTTGQGVVEIEDRIDFGLTYIHKPWPAFGHEIDPDDVRDALGLDGEPIPFLPQVTGYISEWDQDDKHNYVGAWVTITVSYPAEIPVDAQIAIVHYVSFQGVALKDVPVDFDD